MPKIKAPARSPHIDMTPMVDLFSLLLTFFMLTATFRPQEAAPITTPSSVSEKQAPDNDLMTIFISKDGKVFFNIDNGKDTSTHFRMKLLEKIGEQYKITFTPKELEKFGTMSSFGMPIKDIKSWLNEGDAKIREKLQVGIPMDSTDNQLAWWVRLARLTNVSAEVALKGDAETNYTVVKKVMDLLQDNKVNKFNLVTNLSKDEVLLKDVPK
ncbi:MAG: biopolymer transporter ExbD [Bacteroidales bacterium]|nr:biopolymer transporter ExbD [Bacteroidales bacterium]MDD4603176.1 biopolymer transporter ExbD [Bacteroidales bacterium]